MIYFILGPNIIEEHRHNLSPIAICCYLFQDFNHTQNSRLSRYSAITLAMYQFFGSVERELRTLYSEDVTYTRSGIMACWTNIQKLEYPVESRKNFHRRLECLVGTLGRISQIGELT